MNQITVSHGKQLGISLMHDNERAYCCRALDVLGLIGQTLV
jgi:glyceraldehyde 3-phosphate dehydrogenase